MEIQSLLEVINRHAAAVGMRIDASKTKALSAIVPGEQRQAVVQKKSHWRTSTSSNISLFLFTANGQGADEIKSWNNLDRSAILSLVVALAFVAYKWQSLRGSGVIESALRPLTALHTSLLFQPIIQLRRRIF